MRQLMDRIFARYGSEAELQGTERQKVRVFFESVNRKSRQNMQTQQHLLGQLPMGQYICRFPAGTVVKKGDTLNYRGRSYGICRVEEMVGPGGSFLWAMCTEKGSGAE